MLGTIVNSLSVIVGSLLGLFLKNGIKTKYQTTIIDGVSLALIVIGLLGAIESQNIVLVVISLALGGLIGEAIDIEARLDRLGQRAQSILRQGDSNFAKAFINGTLVFCIGSMAIVGSLESGLTGNHQILFAKSTLDGIFSIIFTSTLGIGNIFSAISIFVYQGGITLLAKYVKDILTPELITEMTAVGGILIMALGFNQLEIKKIRVSNLLPSIIIPVIYFVVLN